MNRVSTLALRIAILLIGALVLAICIFALPAAITTGDTGHYYPILLGLYVPAVPFLFALYQALRLLHYIDKNTAFSVLSIVALKRIKYCAVSISLLFTAGMPYLFIVAQADDAPGVILIGLFIIFVSVVVAIFATVLQKLFQNAIAIKSENDLTV